MLATVLLLGLATIASLVSADCTEEQRLAGARLIVASYNAVEPGQSEAGFEKLPLEGNCHTFVNPNGGPPIPFAIDRATTVDFAINTRQVFSKVTGAFTDFDNGTTIIHTNVTLGVLHDVALPVTFYADVFLNYNLDDCLMYKIQAFAQIPTVVAGVPIQPPILNTLLAASPLYADGNLPTPTKAKAKRGRRGA